MFQQYLLYIGGVDEPPNKDVEVTCLENNISCLLIDWFFLCFPPAATLKDLVSIERNL